MIGRRGGLMTLQRSQGALQGLDRVSPLGGQLLHGLTLETLQLQGVLELSNPFSNRLASCSATRGLVMVFPGRPSGLLWPQVGRQQLLGRDPP